MNPASLVGIPFGVSPGMLNLVHKDYMRRADKEEPYVLLMKALGIYGLPNVWVARLTNLPIKAYVLFYDTRRPKLPMTIMRIRRVQAFGIKRAKHEFGKGVKLAQVKLRPPVPIKNSDIELNSPTLIIRYDMAGEYFRKDVQISESVHTKKLIINHCEVKVI